MRRMILISIFAIAILVASCSQPGYPGMIPGLFPQNNPEVLNPVEGAKRIQLDKLVSDVLSGESITGLNVGAWSEYVQPEIILLRANSDISNNATGKSYATTVTFSGYDNGFVTIDDGSIQLILKTDGTEDNTVNSFSIVEERSLVVSSTGFADFTLGIENVAGTIETTVTVSEGNVSVAPAKNVAVSLNSTISMNGTTVSQAEAADLVSGGDGLTAETAFKISTKEEFLGMSEICAENMEGVTYFELTDDIELYASDYVDQFSGVLSGGEQHHSISIVSGGGDPVSYVFRATGIRAEFRDLDFHTAYEKMLVYGDELMDATGKIILDTEFVGFYNVDAYGEMNDVGTNTGIYLTYGESNEIVFDGCTNNASIYGSSVAYAAPFLGYLVGNSTSLHTNKLTFNNCTNNGNVVIGSAGMIVANGGNTGNWVCRYVTGESGAVPEGGIRLIVNNFTNNGKITGYGGNAGAFTWNTQDGHGDCPQSNRSWEAINTYVSQNTTGTGRIDNVGIEGLQLTAKSDADGSNVELSATINGEAIPSQYRAVYEKSYYGHYKYPNGDDAGTLRTVIEVDPANAGSKFVDRSELREFIINGVEMILVEPGENATWTYSVTLYDSDNHPVDGINAGSIIVRE